MTMAGVPMMSVAAVVTMMVADGVLVMTWGMMAVMVTLAPMILAAPTVAGRAGAAVATGMAGDSGVMLMVKGALAAEMGTMSLGRLGGMMMRVPMVAYASPSDAPASPEWTWTPRQGTPLGGRIDEEEVGRRR